MMTLGSSFWGRNLETCVLVKPLPQVTSGSPISSSGLSFCVCYRKGWTSSFLWARNARRVGFWSDRVMLLGTDPPTQYWDPVMVTGFCPSGLSPLAAAQSCWRVARAGALASSES